MSEPIKTKITGTITSASMPKKNDNDQIVAQILEMTRRAKLPNGTNGLLARVDGKTYSYISVDEFAAIIFPGTLKSQLESATEAVFAMLGKVATGAFDEKLCEKRNENSTSETSNPLDWLNKKVQTQAKYLISIKNESEPQGIEALLNTKRNLLTLKGCEIIIGMIGDKNINFDGYWKVMKYFQVTKLLGSSYKKEGDCLVGITVENLGVDDESARRDTHEKLTLGERLSYNKDDPAYIVRQFKDKHDHQYHTAYITSIGIAELIFRNRYVENCKKIEVILDRIDLSIKKLGGKGLEKWGCKTSLDKKMRYIIKRNDFIHMCDRLKWEEQYRLPDCDWDIRDEGLAGFRAATIAWNEAQDLLKRKVEEETRAELELESPAAQAQKPTARGPFDFGFEGRTQSQAETTEMPNSSTAPTPAAYTTTQPPAPPEKTIAQKLQEIADRANAKKREIDEAMNLEMVALFSEECKSKAVKENLTTTAETGNVANNMLFSFS